MYQSRKIIRADGPASAAYTGKSIGIAVLDTGIYPHEDFILPSDRIAAFRDFVHRQPAPYDDNGHGTHVCGIIAGNGRRSEGRYRGIAPESHLVVGKILDSNGNGSISHILEAVRWIIENRQRYNIRVLNISVGSESTEVDEQKSILVQSVNAAWDSGIVVVVAAGNNGPKRMSVTSPGISRKVITVGSSDDHKTVLLGGSRIHNYSGRGPTDDCIVKPDVFAPGTGIVSCNAFYSQFPNAPPYLSKTGTSMAAPVVSGAIACLLSKYPFLTNAEVKLKLHASCVQILGTESGWGILDFSRLLE